MLNIAIPTWGENFNNHLALQKTNISLLEIFSF
jgi:hypothetical protein